MNSGYKVFQGSDEIEHRTWPMILPTTFIANVVK
jgi:hypothetical protein